MAELVQGQSAPEGMKTEGFVDALHRVRQVGARPAGGSTGTEAGPGRARWGRGGRAWAGRQLGRTLRRAWPVLGLLQPGGAEGRSATARPRPSPSGGSPRCQQPLE